MEFNIEFFLDEGLDMNLIGEVAENLIHPLPIPIQIAERGERPRNEDYVETIVPLYDDNLFKEHFRMSRGTCEHLVNLIGNRIQGEQNNLVPLNKKVLFTLWVLSKPESFLAAGDRFDLAKSTGHSIFKEIINTLVQLLPEFVRWPNDAEQQTSINIFKRRSNGFIGVVGAIDGCHIPCKQPKDNAVDFYNRKGFHSIILQGICDQNARFIDVFIGMPGRMHDSRVFRNSPIFRGLSCRNDPLLLASRHLIGDAAYPIMENLLTPFRDTGHLTQAQTTYNIKLSCIRSIVERAFGLLKGKFRRLKYLDIADFELGNNMIAAACVLHNFIIDHHDVDQDHDVEQEYENDQVENENEENIERVPGTAAAGIEKRNNIMHLVSR